MTDIEAFLKGYKNALLYNPSYNHSIYTREEMNQLEQFPRISVTLYRMDQLLYFRTENILKHFLGEVKDIEPDSPLFHKEIGLVLGFPPKAVDFFINTVNKSEMDKQKIKLGYCGVDCVTSLDTLIEDVYFLWRSIDAPNIDRTPTFLGYKSNEKDKSFYIPYGDREQLIQAYKTIKNTLISQG